VLPPKINYLKELQFQDNDTAYVRAKASIFATKLTQHTRNNVTKQPQVEILRYPILVWWKHSTVHDSKN